LTGYVSSRHEIRSYEEAFFEAGNADETMKKKLEQCRDQLMSLTQERLEQNEPVLERPMVSLQDTDRAIAGLRSRLQELEDLANQRAGIEQRVRDAKDSDEILPKIMAAGPDAHEELFSQEMKKYESFDEEIKRNEELQRQALKSTKAHRDELVAGFDVEV